MLWLVPPTPRSCIEFWTSNIVSLTRKSFLSFDDIEEQARLRFDFNEWKSFKRCPLQSPSPRPSSWPLTRSDKCLQVNA